MSYHGLSEDSNQKEPLRIYFFGKGIVSVQVETTLCLVCCQSILIEDKAITTIPRGRWRPISQTTTTAAFCGTSSLPTSPMCRNVLGVSQIIVSKGHAQLRHLFQDIVAIAIVVVVSLLLGRVVVGKEPQVTHHNVTTGVVVVVQGCFFSQGKTCMILCHKRKAKESNNGH